MMALAFTVISCREREAKSSISPSLSLSLAGLSAKPPPAWAPLAPPWPLAVPVAGCPVSVEAVGTAQSRHRRLPPSQAPNRRLRRHSRHRLPLGIGGPSWPPSATRPRFNRRLHGNLDPTEGNRHGRRQARWAWW